MYNYDERRELNRSELLQVYASCGFLWASVFALTFFWIYGMLMTGGVYFLLAVLGIVVIGLTALSAFRTLDKFGVY